jgi:serine/threonine protein kinase
MQRGSIMTADITSTIHVSKSPGSLNEQGSPNPLKQEAQALRLMTCDAARELHLKSFQGSNIPDKSDNFPKFHSKEVQKGKMLGKGGFGTVLEVRGFHIENQNTNSQLKGQSRSKSDEEVSSGKMESRKVFIADRCFRDGGDARYAVKTLSPEILKDHKIFFQAMADMATKTRVLSSIMHPNIVKLRAIAEGSWFHEDYFIVMDRLCETLEKRLASWGKRHRGLGGIVGKLVDRKGKKRAKLYDERVVAAFDLSAALAYLHKNLIIHRDLKPENIGFDIVSTKEWTVSDRNSGFLTPAYACHNCLYSEETSRFSTLDSRRRSH